MNSKVTIDLIRIIANPLSLIHIHVMTVSTLKALVKKLLNYEEHALIFLFLGWGTVFKYLGYTRFENLCPRCRG